MLEWVFLALGIGIGIPAAIFAWDHYSLKRDMAEIDRRYDCPASFRHACNDILSSGRHGFSPPHLEMDVLKAYPEEFVKERGAPECTCGYEAKMRKRSYKAPKRSGCGCG